MALFKDLVRKQSLPAPLLPPLERIGEEALRPVLGGFLMAQASVLERSARNQGARLERAELLMTEAVLGFGQSLKQLDDLVHREFQLSMELRRVMDVSGQGEQEAQSVGAFASRILGTLDLFVQAMLETGQSSFQLVEETSGIRSRSSSMTEALVELAEVAMRIQMLSLNASIEAAHARQFGAGFAIVAGEVQKLAVRSSRISDQISGLVRETESALERTSAQVELIASKDLNEVIRSKQMADAMVQALETSDRNAQDLVGQMEQVNREVRDALTIAHSALQFEDIVHQLLGSVAAGSEQLARFALRVAALAGEVDLGQRPMADLLAQATLDFEGFGRELDDPEPSSESLSQIELF